MIELRNQRALVVGLARTGRAVARRLSREGAVVTVTDLRPPWSFGASLTELMDQKVGLELGVHRPETFLNQDLIVVSPGVPWDMPQLDDARRRKILVVPEVEAASWFFQGTLVGITGTNGKTTTTTLAGKMLEASGFQTYVAGNIGVPLISAVDLYSAQSILIAELSSFQLEAIQNFRPHVALLLNLTANHLDRHRTFEAYVSAKAQIFRNQRPEDCAILNADDPVVMGLAPAIASRKVFFSLEQDLPEGVLLSHGRILYRVGHLERVLFEEREINLRGKFNIQNVMAAAAVACILGADFKAIRDTVRHFTGVEHRLEYVGSLRGVAFYNDSKATSVDAAAKALSTFDRGVHLILGGMDKGAPYTPLKPLIEGRVKSIYLIGSAAEKIAADLEGADLHHAGHLAAAVTMAFHRAIPGDIILLSPACSSYDQFQDFEDRGRAFKEIAAQLEKMPVPEVPLRAASPMKTAQGLQPVAGEALVVRAPDSGTANPQSGLEVEIEKTGTSSEPPAPSPAEPVYVYEVESEETPPAEQGEAPPETVETTASDSEGGLIEENTPVLPYEITDIGGAGADDALNSGRQAKDAPGVAQEKSGLQAGPQPSLFAQDRVEKP